MTAHPGSLSRLASRAWPVQAHLLALAFGVALPLLAFGGVVAWRYAEAERARIESDAGNSAREVAGSLDVMLTELTTTSRVLAGSDPLQAGDLAAFHPRAVEVARLLGGNVGLRDADSRQLLNSAIPWGGPLPGRSSLGAEDAEAARTGQPVVSGGFTGIADGLYQFGIVLPLPPGGPARFLNVTVPAARVQQVLEAVVTPPSGVQVTVVDGRGNFLAYHPGPEGWVGRPARILPQTAAVSGSVAGTDVNGVSMRVFIRASAIAGWRVGVGVPEAALRAPMLRALWTLAAAAVAALLLTAGVAWLGARRIGDAIRALSTAGAALADDRAVAMPATRVREANEVGAVLAAAAAERIARDDARRQVEAALADSEARMRAVLDSIPLSVVVAEAPSGRLLFGNPGLEAVFRYPLIPSASIDDYGEWEAYHDAAGLRRVQGSEFPLAQTLLTGQPRQGEYLFACGDGVRRWIAVRCVPIAGAGGSLSGAACVCMDVDDQRRAGERLEQQVAARTQDLQAALARAAHAERMQALGQLAGGIAHDLNNVLQAVHGGAALIDKRAENAASTRRLARLVLDAAERGSSVTRRLLSFARHGDLRAEVVELVPLLNGLHEILTHALGADVSIRMAAAPDLPSLLVDKGQLETVLVNLATNARDAMPGGGTLTLSADTRPPPAGLPPGRYVRLQVEDTGAGMDPATLARVTEPFFTTKPQGKGTGLGLSMAKGFAEQSGGTLELRSAPGQGTTVTLWLPQAEMDARTEHDATPASKLPPRPDDRPTARRVLLVDDDALVRQTLVEQLEDAGYAVTAVAGAAEALAQLAEGTAVDVMVTDLTMPGGMDGLTLVREAQTRRPGLPAVLLTGYAGDGAGAALAVSGAVTGTYSLLRKPVSGAQLTDRVASLLAGTEAARAV